MMNEQINRWVADPGWHSLIIWYFFLGGIAAGAYVMAALADLFGDAEDRRAARVGYYLAFPLVCVCGMLADHRPGPAGTVLAHDDQVKHGLADVQVVVADVGRLVGLVGLRRCSVSLHSWESSPRMAGSA